VGDPRITGKPNGTDFREGFATLPLLHYYQHATPDERARLQREFGTDLSPEQFNAWREQIRLTGSLRYAEALAEQYRQRALARLGSLPASPIRTTLEEVARFITERKY